MFPRAVRTEGPAELGMPSCDPLVLAEPVGKLGEDPALAPQRDCRRKLELELSALRRRRRRRDRKASDWLASAGGLVRVRGKPDPACRSAPYLLPGCCPAPRLKTRRRNRGIHSGRPPQNGPRRMSN